MIKFILGLGAVLFATSTAFGAVTALPTNVSSSSFHKVIKAKLNETIAAANTNTTTLGTQTADGNYALRVAKASFSYADGDLAITTPHGLGVSLPANAIVIRSWIHIATQLVDTGTCSLAIQCEDANNIKTSTDISGTAADGLIEGESTGAASAFKKAIAATCELQTLMTDTSSCVPSAGAGEVYVMYVVHN